MEMLNRQKPLRGVRVSLKLSSLQKVGQIFLPSTQVSRLFG